jgi:hypothetical protein
MKIYNLGTFALLTALASMTACGGGGSNNNVSGDNFPSRDSKYNSATDYYGPLVVSPGEVDYQVTDPSTNLPSIPWAGYWLPSNSTYMFQHASGQDYSPLEKYDMYMKKAHGQTTTAAQTERDTLYNPLAGPADGHCDAWSIASIYENDPTPGGWQNPHNATLNGVTFTPGDIKSLLIDTYEEQSLVKMIGEKYVDLTDDPLDLYPDQFHAVLKGELGSNRLFIVDRDPGPEVWNTPINSAQIQIAADATNPQLLHVTAYVGTVDAIGEGAFAQDSSGNANPNWVGDPTEAEYAEIYTYDLYGDQQADGSFAIKSGVWTGDSVQNHPDFALIKIAGATQHQSLNTQVDVGIVNEIISKGQQVSK